MMYLETKNGLRQQWWTGYSKPLITLDQDEDIEIKYIQADGDELELIKSKFTNLPMFSGRVVIFKNDLAQFIFDNLW